MTDSSNPDLKAPDAEDPISSVSLNLCKRLAEAKRLAPVINPAFFTKWTKDLFSLLFPSVQESNQTTCNEIKNSFAKLQKELASFVALLRSSDSSRLTSTDKAAPTDREQADIFFNSLEEIYDLCLKDCQAIYEADPAADSVAEVIAAYPGFWALAWHRVAHQLYLQDLPLIPRVLSENAHQMTGVDIHPGAKIGSRCAIDHGTGIVIGETTVIGDRVKIYQGVTLGAHSVSKKKQGLKRHPTVEDNVTIYAGATILGGDTVIGAGSIIGGNTWITKSVAPGSVVTLNL